MPQAAQLWLALVYAYHVVSVSSEMLFCRDGLPPSQSSKSMYPS